MTGTILVLNAGSSSIKFELFGIDPGGDLGARFAGQVEGVGTPAPGLRPRTRRAGCSSTASCRPSRRRT